MKTSILQGTVAPADVFIRHELPRLENEAAQLLASFGKRVARWKSILSDGLAIRTARTAPDATVTADEMRRLAPDSVAELQTIVDAAETMFASLGAAHLLAAPKQRPAPAGTTETKLDKIGTTEWAAKARTDSRERRAVTVIPAAAPPAEIEATPTEPAPPPEAIAEV